MCLGLYHPCYEVASYQEGVYALCGVDNIAFNFLNQFVLTFFFANLILERKKKT